MVQIAIVGSFMRYIPHNFTMLLLVVCGILLAIIDVPKIAYANTPIDPYAGHLADGHVNMTW